MKQKLLLLLLGVLMTLPALARDFEYTYEGQTITYTVINESFKTCETKAGYWDSRYVAGNSITGSLNLPANPKDGDVEYTLTSISDVAFARCGNLTSIVIPNSVTSIGSHAFWGCSSLTSVVIPNSVTSIGSVAFWDCSSLTSVVIPNSVTSIGWSAFEDCSGLTSVVIGNSVTSIGSDAFKGCRGLKKSAYPNTLENPFEEGIAIAYNPEEDIVEDGWIWGSNKSAIYFAPLNLEGEYTIPESVTEIGCYAFRDCSDLTSVEIPNSVEIIGKSGFSRCSNLTIVKMSNSIREIGAYAFYACNLIDIILPSPHVYVGKSAFANCKKIFAVLIEGEDSQVESDAFDECSFLQKAACRNPALFTSVNAFNNDKVVQWTIEEDEVFDPEGIIWAVSEEESPFVMPSYRGEVKIPSKVTGLHWSCLAICPYVTAVILPQSLTGIGNQAFCSCSALKDVLIPSAVTKIGSDVFLGTRSLVKGGYPSSIGNPFPDSCLAIEYDCYDSKTDDGFAFSRNGKTLYYAPVNIGTKYELPESTIEISDKAFSCCTELETLILNKELAKIGDSCWSDCNRIKDIVCKSQIPAEAANNIFSRAVYDNANLYVPSGSKSKFETTAPWSYFYNIKDTEYSNVDEIVSQNDSDIDMTQPYYVYNMNGFKVGETKEGLSKGIYIIRQGNTAVKMVVR